ncbi:hypothetical protein LCGC14_1416410 [marine sediment metagenome]|uniref:Uncharacterized protein n=1 Tax=marine sediment metagenome TaxID=412755 RepID=A0A0F9KDX6_9ZZZZ
MRNKPLRNQTRDGRVWLPRHAPLVMMGCEALGTMYLQRRLHSCWGLAKTPTVNNRELAINPVSAQGRKVVIRPAKRQADSRRCLSIALFPFVAQSGNSEYLRELYNVNHTEHGKPDEPHDSGILTVRKGDGSAGRGTKKKRMPSCNKADRVF